MILLWVGVVVAVVLERVGRVRPVIGEFLRP
jgi:hypothetical protein